MTQTLTIEVPDLGSLLRVWRLNARLSLPEAAARAQAYLPPNYSVSRELVRMYENNQFPRRGRDPHVVAAITRACGHELRELPEDVLEDLDVLGKLARSRCFAQKALIAA